jgi:CRP/FNR family cyclic AMP-dependent transcriptional regulator
VDLIEHRSSSQPRIEARPPSKELRALRRCVLFTPLDEATEIIPLLAQASSMTIERRRPVGSVGDGFVYIIASGRVRVVQPDDERELTVEYLATGDLVGETQLWNPAVQRRAIAVDETEVVRLPLAALRGLLSSNAAFCSALLMVTGERRMVAERRLHALLSRPVESRVADFLLNAAERHGIPDARGTLISVKFTHQEIASYVGSTRETVTLVLGEFKRAGILSIDQRRVVVIDPTMLRDRR